MHNILITNSYFYRYDSKQWEFAQPYAPLGTLYAAAVLRKENYNVRFYDSCLVEDHLNIEPQFDASQKVFVIYDDGFNYLTKMCLTKMREAAYDMIRLAKERNIIVIVNSSDSTDHYESYHKKGADFIIHGEGEGTLVELCNAIHEGTNPYSTQGISYIIEDTIVKNAPRPVKRELDDLPMPAWDLLDAEPYRKIWEEHHGYFTMNIATTRGCPYKCNWCAKPIYGNRYNTRSPENVIAEMAFIIDRFNVNYFWMCDDIFGLKPGWVQKFKELKEENKLQFKYKIQSRVDLMLQDNNLDALAESGADMIWVGAESGSQKILDAMDKGTQVEQIYDATKKLKDRNVKVAFFLQFGYLDETMEDIRQTIKMVLDLMPDDIGISVSYPLPGTSFYDKVKNDLNHKANWKDSDDLDMMFQNTYPPIFYKTLHRYVHNRYRIKKGILSTKNMMKAPISSLSSNLKDILRLIYHSPQALYNEVLLRKYAKVKP